MTERVPHAPEWPWQVWFRIVVVFCALGAIAIVIGEPWRHRQKLSMDAVGGAPASKPLSNVLRNQPLPIVRIEGAAGLEGEKRDFSLSLSAESSTPVVVQFATSDGTAIAGQDYVPIPLSSVTFKPGEMWKTITVETKSDYDEDEETETFIVKLVSADGASLSTDNAVGQIFDGSAPAEIAIARFYGDGTNLKIDYKVSGEVFVPFKIAVGASFPGEGFSKELCVGDGEAAAGDHTLTLIPAFDDFQCDYRWMAFADSDYDVGEINEENNFVSFSGGAFVVHEPTSGKMVLHIHATDFDDQTYDLKPASIDEVHFRGHAGSDRFDLPARFKGIPGWFFGGEGDDSLIGSLANDIIFGGPGNDILRGGGGDDLLVGGDGFDKLYGESGKDQLFGGPDNDELVDADENSIFDGGLGRDLFNGQDQNPRVAPVFDALQNHFRGVEEEHELRIDLASRFRPFIESFPEHTWQVNYKGAAIARWSVKDDVLHIQFNADVPEDSLVEVRVTGRKSDDKGKREPERSDNGSFHVYSIAVTGYKLERKIGPGENDWIEEEGAIWSSDMLRWRPLYEPKEVPIQWEVKWVSKAWKDLDHPRIEWDVFSSGAMGQTPIANPPTGIRAITPQFIFKRGTPQAENTTPTVE
jgi:Calx-beta domain/RTX calcium-binding nonapeptide repeat (4 copies)